MDKGNVDNVGVMGRKGIAIDEGVHDDLNRFRLGGESWNDFFKRHLALGRFTRDESPEK